MAGRPQPDLYLPRQGSLCLPGSARLVWNFASGFSPRSEKSSQTREAGRVVSWSTTWCSFTGAKGVGWEMGQGVGKTRKGNNARHKKGGVQVQRTQSRNSWRFVFRLAGLSQRRGFYSVGGRHYCCLGTSKTPAPRIVQAEEWGVCSSISGAALMFDVYCSHWASGSN